MNSSVSLDPTINTSQISREEIVQHIAKYAHNPLRWAREVCGFEPDVWQAQAMIEFSEKRFCAWSAGSGVGKTCILAILVLYFLSTRDSPKIACTAPSLHQLNDVLWSELKKWMDKSVFLTKNFKWTATKVCLKGNEGRWFAVARTAKPSTASETSAVEGLQGMHEGNILFICDEACFDAETEILTDDGWKFFKDLTQSEKVLTLNLKTFEASYTQPVTYQEYDYVGEMYKCTQRSTNFCVTPNHNMFYGTQIKKSKYELVPRYKWDFSTALQLSMRHEYFLNRAFSWKDAGKRVDTYTIPGIASIIGGGKGKTTKAFPARIVDMTTWASFLGWFLSEGHICYTKGVPYAVGITQKDLTNQAVIRYNIQQLGYNVETYDREMRIHDKALATHLADLGKNALDKYVPRYIHELSPPQINEFLSSYFLGDGYVKGNREIFYTSSKQMADDLQELIFKSGSISSIQKRKIEGQRKWIVDHWATSSADGYIISRYACNTFAKIRSRNVKKISYNGKVYCVTVEPHHTIFTRRHGYCMWSGQSGVPDQVMGAIEGSLTTHGACAILASNPTRKTGMFYKIITDPKYQEDWCVRTISALDAKHVDQAAIRRVTRTWGIHSDYYRVKVLGLPPLIDEQALCSPEQMFEAHERILGTDGLTVVSCDPARYGSDPCKFYVRKGMTIVDSAIIHSMDTQQVAKVLVDLIEKHDPDKVYVDGIGIGAGVVDATKKLLKVHKSIVHEVVVGEKSSKPEKYINRRAELFWNMRVLIDYISLPFETEFLDQELTTIQYKWNQTDTKIRIQSKDDIKALLRRSPNDADALVLVFYDELLEKKMVKVSGRHFRIGAGGETQERPRQDLKKATVHPDGRVTQHRASVFGPRGGNPYGTNRNVNAAFGESGRVGKRRFSFMRPSW